MWFLTFLIVNLRRRAARSLLTGGGVAIAVGTAVTLLGIAYGFRESAAESLGARGVEVMVVQEGVLDPLTSDLDASLLDRIRDVPGVGGVTPGLIELIDFPKQNNVISVMIQGWMPGSFLFEELNFIEGAAFETDDRKTATLGVTLAENLGKSVGDTIEIQRETFEIVGIYESFSVFENGAITVPLKQLQEVMVRDESVTGFSVQVDRSSSGEAVSSEEVCRQINDLRDADGEHLGISALPTQEYVNNMVYLKMAEAFAWLTSSIAIAVGTLGLLNTMLMSVIERIKEIGILRAIGWRKSRVVRRILGECLMVSFAGAEIGTLLAVALTRWLATVPAVSGFIEGSVAPTVIALGFLLAMGVAMIGGAYPAYRATKLRPAEGISHE